MTPTEKGAACFAATLARSGVIVFDDASEAFANSVVDPAFAVTDEEQDDFMYGWDTAYDAAMVKHERPIRVANGANEDRALFDASDYED